MTEVVLDIRDLHKRFDRLPVLQGVSAQATRGEVIGLVGLNGAGKTTLLETVLGFNEPNQGSIHVFGNPSDQLSAMAAKSRIGFAPQQDELLSSLTGARYLELIAAFYPDWDARLTERLRQEWQVPLDREISHLSAGQRQKLSIMSALSYKPDLIILDEPVASLDPVARRQFLAELVSIAHDRQSTIIFSTHIVSDLERVADRLWLLKEGRLLIDEQLDQLKERVVKITLPAVATVPQDLLTAHTLHTRATDSERTWILGGWSETLAAQINDAVGILDAQWTLSLEEIFLELHA